MTWIVLATLAVLGLFVAWALTAHAGHLDDQAGHGDIPPGSQHPDDPGGTS